MLQSGLWVILLEAGVALGLGIFIVWWTWPRKPKAGVRADNTVKQGADKDNPPGQ